MERIGLALSGGGFRATLYHLGVVRALRDGGLLGRVVDIASVSGGSVLAAHLVLNWDRYTGSDGQFAEAAAEVIRFVQHDVRNRIVRRLPLLFPLRLAAKVAGWHAPGLTPNAVLERYYRDFLYGDRRLFELPEQPRLHILATNVGDGVMAVFNRDGLHVQKREQGERDPFHHVPGQSAAIARAVAASSAFPGFFPPVEITATDLGVHEGQFATESFTDGGVYDNLGTRAFIWLQRHLGSRHDRVLVSDAGKPFQILGGAPLGFIAQSIRATDILWDRVWQLERENFGDQNGFSFLPVTRIVDPHTDPHALHTIVQAEVSSIRTDLDRFSDLEVNALVQHGYEVARACQRQLGGAAAGGVPDGPPWEPLAGRGSLAAVRGETAAAAMDRGGHGTARTAATAAVATVAKQLRRSGQRKVWATLLDARDWPSYVFIALGLFVFGYLPVRFYQLHQRAEMLTGVIDSIAKGDPDIRLVLDLMEADPLPGWTPIPINDAQEPMTPDYSGVEVLSRSRIIDLRPALARAGRGDGRVHVRERIVLRVKEGQQRQRQRQVMFRSMMPVEDMEYRQPAGRYPITARRAPDRDPDGNPLMRYELHCDISRAPVNEPVRLEAGFMMRTETLAESRMPFVSDVACDLLTVWMLFPEDHPYRSYTLVRYPRSGDGEPEPMMPRYEIDHPHGQLIGWSVITPRADTVYECRWTEE
jgi:predicted acylesterase/phospholipase RssA